MGAILKLETNLEGDNKYSVKNFAENEYLSENT
jgi:hypothetical protein